MNNPEVPTGTNGKNELKITRSDDVENLLDKFFEEQGPEKIHINCLTFDVPAEKIHAAMQQAGVKSFDEVINNPDPARKTFDPLQINAGPRVKEGKADKRKVKTKVDQIKQRKLAKNRETAGKNETRNNDSRDSR